MATSQFGSHTNNYRTFSGGVDEVILRRPQEGKSVELTVNGDHYDVGRIASAFPVSSAADPVVFFDNRGEEIGIMNRVRALDAESRHLLEEELEKAYFMPQIRRVLSIQESLGIQTWQVHTNKGRRTFDVRSPRQNVRKISNSRVLVKDVDGNRYEIRNMRRLDRRSCHLVTLQL